VTPDLHATVGRMLEAEGQRYTRGRRALVELLATAEGPVTVPQIVASDPSLAQSSAYRSLAALNDAGVVHRIVTGDDHGHFELAESLTGNHHHHLVCSNCGSVEDFTVPPDLERAIDLLAEGTASRHGFAVQGHSLDLVGTCSACS
jgi:Fur family ferric uptake transcriptional regulator